MAKRELDIVGYILCKLGCLHPFRISRVLALAELRSLEDKGSRLTSLDYRGQGQVFYIEGFKEKIKQNKCFNIREGDLERRVKSCIEYICAEPTLPEDIKSLLDKVIEDTRDLSDEGLNRLVSQHPLYSRLVKPMLQRG